MVVMGMEQDLAAASCRGATAGSGHALQLAPKVARPLAVRATVIPAGQVMVAAWASISKSSWSKPLGTAGRSGGGLVGRPPGPGLLSVSTGIAARRFPQRSARRSSRNDGSRLDGGPTYRQAGRPTDRHSGSIVPLRGASLPTGVGPGDITACLERASSSRTTESGSVRRIASRWHRSEVVSRVVEPEWWSSLSNLP